MKPTQRIVKRIVPAMAVWAIGKALDAKPVRKRLDRADERMIRKRAAVKKAATRGARNARHHRAWLAAGAAAVITGIGMMARAAKK